MLELGSLRYGFHGLLRFQAGFGLPCGLNAIGATRWGGVE